MMLRSLPLALMLTIALGATPAFAQPADSGARAVEVGHQGIALYQAGKFAEALAKFREADALSHSPVFQLYIARCHVHERRLLTARDTYRGILERTAADDEPAPWKNARVDARDELAALLPRIPSLLLVIAGADSSLTVTVDGAAAKPHAAIEVDPGQRTIVAVQGGARREIVVEVGEREKEKPVAIDLRPASSGNPPSPPARPPPREPTRGSLVPGGVLVGVGGAALLVGTITGVVSLVQASDIKERCGADDGACPRSLQADIQPDIDATKRLGHVTTGMLIGGGVVAGVGVVLLIVRPGGDDEGERTQAGVVFTPSMGGGYFSGRF